MVPHIQVLLAGFKATPGERTYQPLYEAIREKVEELASLGVGLLTDLKDASAFYLYDATIGVLHIPAPRWSDDRKHAVEAEQKELQSRICRARRQCTENELRKDPFAPIPAPLVAYYDAVKRKIRKKASEVVVKAPYAYPVDRKGLVHDVIIVVYKGQQDGDVINFPLSNPNDKADLDLAINMAKSAAFAHYNRHKGYFKKELKPADYGVWVYIDDYPDGTPSGNGFSGTSFTLAVAIGIWACLRKIKMDEKHEIAATGEINSPQGGLNDISSINLKAKAVRLGGVEKLFASIDIAKELEALSSIIEARKIQFSLYPNQRPANTEVLPVNSLEEVLKQIPIPFPIWLQWLIKVWKKICIYLPWVLIGMAVFMLLAGVSWFHFDKPTPISRSFYVNPREIEGYEGEIRDLTVHVNFHSRVGTTLWLTLASVLYERFYWIEYPGPELVIRNANFNATIQCTVPRSKESIAFILKDRDNNVFASADVDINVKKIPRGGQP